MNDANATKFRYNCKELQDEEVTGSSLGWYDYGARMYDPSLGRWHVADPMAEAYTHYSPYAYVLNNPLRQIDPTGMLSTSFDSDEAEEDNKHKNSEVEEFLKKLYAGARDGSTFYFGDNNNASKFVDEGNSGKDNDKASSGGKNKSSQKSGGVYSLPTIDGKRPHGHQNIYLKKHLKF